MEILKPVETAVGVVAHAGATALRFTVDRLKGGAWSNIGGEPNEYTVQAASVQYYTTPENIELATE